MKQISFTWRTLVLFGAAILVSTGLYSVPVQVHAMGNSDAKPPKTAAQDFKAGRSAVYAGRFDTAIRLMKKVVKEEPKNADAHNYLGFSYRQTGKLDLAASSYKQVFAIDPNHKGALEYQGELFLKLGNVAKANQNLAKLEKLCPRGCKELNELRKAIAGHSPSRGS